MAKLTLANLSNLQNESSAVSTINNNSDLIEIALENTLSRDGTSPNEMESSLDMNDNRILNLPLPVDPTEPARKGEVDDLIEDVQDIADIAQTFADAAEASALNAAGSEANAAASVVSAAAILDSFDDRYLGAKTSDPILDNDGNALTTGALYFNSLSNALKVYNGSIWLSYSAASGLTELLDDTSPQLGGNLDPNGHTITGYSTTTQANALYQPLDSDLTAIAAIAPANDDIIQRKAGAWTNRTMAQLYSDLGVAANFQPLDADLTSWAGVTRAAGFDTFTATPSSANLRALLSDEVGTGAAYFVGGALGTPASATLTNATALPVAGITASTVTALGVGSIELGHATDCTLSRNASGRPQVETNLILLNSTENQGPLTGGAAVTFKDLGTISSGTVTPDLDDRSMQKYTNNGAHTLAYTTSSSNVTTLYIVNGASAGAITLSGLTRVGDAFTTVNGDSFTCSIVVYAGLAARIYVTANQ